MKIKSAEFIKSAVKPDQYPESDLAEIAFAGRSNVGKSSLINTLLNRKNLVKTSSTPGKTRLINFFLINEFFYFVDLPGYGYAKVSASERAKWGPMVEAYLTIRSGLKGVMILQDIRRTPGREEHELVEFLTHTGLPFFYIITKADKISRNRQNSRIKEIKNELGLRSSDFISFSSKTRQGRDLVWKQIETLLGTAQGNSDAGHQIEKESISK